MAKSNATKERRTGKESLNQGQRSQKAEVAAIENRQGGERRKVQRRRQIDPTTCERDYSDDEIEFMQAMDNYKRDSGRMFPTCSEMLEVLRTLGYVRLDDEQRGILGLELDKLPAGLNGESTEIEAEEEI